MSEAEDKPEIELDCRVSNPELWDKYIAIKKQSNNRVFVGFISGTFADLNAEPEEIFPKHLYEIFFQKMIEPETLTLIYHPGLTPLKNAKTSLGMILQIILIIQIVTFIN